ncbi:hypothetical protein BDW69DRAFT_100773 [Aspergillus filifer]
MGWEARTPYLSRRSRQFAFLLRTRNTRQEHPLISIPIYNIVSVQNPRAKCPSVHCHPTKHLQSFFRADRRSRTSFKKGYMCARQTAYNGPLTARDFDDHLSWERRPTKFLSFGTWRRAMQRRADLERDGNMDVEGDSCLGKGFEWGV